MLCGKREGGMRIDFFFNNNKFPFFSCIVVMLKKISSHQSDSFIMHNS